MDSNHRWLERFDFLTLRERLLLLAAGSGILLMFGYLLWLSPQQAIRREWQGKIDQVQLQAEQFAAQIAKLEQMEQADPDRSSRRSLAQVERESNALDAQLRRHQQTLISPEAMPKVLKDMLDDLPLALIGLSKLPPEVEIDSDIEGVPKVYRHGLRLELEGSYRDTLDYLERLEKLPWRFAWETLDIRMNDYPRATIILNLYTLSFDEVWLGV